MDIRLNREDKKSISEISTLLESGESFLITTHRNIDGDAIGSELALYGMLKRIGKRVVVLNHDRTPAIYRFLPFSDRIKSIEFEMSFMPDVVLVIDCGSSDRTGKTLEYLQKAPVVINIDHHFSNPGFASVNWVNPGFSATGEMIYFLVREMVGQPSKEEAECLYTAILTDTGSFHHNIGRHTMAVVNELMLAGVNPERIAKKIYMERPLRSVKLLTLALDSLQFDKKHKVCWMKVDKNMFRRSNSKEEDTEGFIDLLVRVKEARIVFLIKETPSLIKVSLRGKGRANVEAIAAKFGGGGHKKAAGCYFSNTTVEEVADKILEEIGKSS